MIKVEKDVIYSGKLGLKADLYYPDDQTIKGAIVDLHGGGWFRGDKEKDADIATEFAKNGFMVAVPNYRYTPEVYFPEPIVDVATMVTWLLQEKNFNLADVMAFGSSAGGNLAVELAIKTGIAAVSWSGILDIDEWMNAHQDVEAKFDQTQDFSGSASAEIDQTGKNDQFYKWFVMNYLQNKPEQVRSATPWRRIDENTGPLFLVNSMDEFVSTSGVTLTVDEMLKNRRIVQTQFIPGSRHAKGYYDVAIDQTILFFNKQIVGDTTVNP